MNYEKIYNQLVEKCRVRGLDKKKVPFYTEAHHIVPVCVGGTNDPSNYVLFSGREHFIAHMLLWKAYPENVSLMRAAHIMSSRWTNETVGGSGRGINSKVYSKLREEYAEAVREQVSGEGNPFYGKTHTEEATDKMKAWHAANPDHGKHMLGRKHSPEAIAKMSEYQRNRPPMSDETRKKISLVHKGKPKNPDAIEKTRQSNIGRVKSEEERKRISEALIGKPWTEAQRAGIMSAMKYGEDHHSYGIPKSAEQKEKISATLKAKNQRPWENPTCQNFTDISKWALADYYYEIWCYFDKPGLKKLKKIYDYINNDEISLSHLAVMRINFSNGWIPQEDEDWLEFSKRVNNE